MGFICVFYMLYLYARRNKEEEEKKRRGKEREAGGGHDSREIKTKAREVAWWWE